MNSKAIQVLYVCDRRKCQNCSEECMHTTDVRHAVSFYEEAPNVFFQRIVPMSVPINMAEVVIDEGE